MSADPSLKNPLLSHTSGPSNALNGTAIHTQSAGASASTTATPQSLVHPPAPQQPGSSAAIPTSQYGQPMYPAHPAAFNGIQPASTPAPMPLTPGGWRPDEIQKLKDLAEQSKAQNTAQAIDWDWVINAFGPSRTRLVTSRPRVNPSSQTPVSCK